MIGVVKALARTRFLIQEHNISCRSNCYICSVVCYHGVSLWGGHKRSWHAEAVASTEAGAHRMFCAVCTGHFGQGSCQPGNSRHGSGTHPHILQG